MNPLLDKGEEVWMKVIPFYRRLGSQEDSPSSAHLRNTRADQLLTIFMDSTETL